MNYSYFDLNYYLYEKNRLKEQNKFYKNHIDLIEKAKRMATIKIQYPEYKESYDYVHKLFPTAKVKNVIIYKLSKSQFDRLGFGFAGGFYSIPSKSVIVCNPSYKRTRESISAKMTVDEIIVHELLHYASEAIGMIIGNVGMAEDFAYGWSLGYLRSKGYSDNNIIQNNYFPYLVDSCFNEALMQYFSKNDISIEEYNAKSKMNKHKFMAIHYSKILEVAKKIAKKQGQAIIESYNKQIEKAIKEAENRNEEEVKSFNRFDILDI